MIVDLIEKLIDRVIQLLKYQKEMRATLIEKHVTLVFTEFEKVHSGYLESFSKYRDLILTSENPNWIRSLQALLEKDNLFSANGRSKVVRLAEAEHDDTLEPFIKGICDYLMGARLVDSLGKQTYPHLTQRWRQSLFRTLDMIAEERWQVVLDPDGAAPPMSREEINDGLESIRIKYQVQLRIAPNDDDMLKRTCSLWALDEIVMGMQSQYDYICSTYMELRTSLSK